MLIKFKLFEELKRKPSRHISIDNIFNDETNFNEHEKRLLEADDFVVTDNKAICKEKYCSFEIEKQADDIGVKFILVVKDKDGVQLKRKGFMNTANAMLNHIIDICAKYNEKIIQELSKDIDPFGEENWGEDNIPNKRVNITPEDFEIIRRIRGGGDIFPNPDYEGVRDVERRRMGLDQEIERIKQEQLRRIEENQRRRMEENRIRREEEQRLREEKRRKKVNWENPDDNTRRKVNPAVYKYSTKEGTTRLEQDAELRRQIEEQRNLPEGEKISAAELLRRYEEEKRLSQEKKLLGDKKGSKFAKALERIKKIQKDPLLLSDDEFIDEPEPEKTPEEELYDNIFGKDNKEDPRKTPWWKKLDDFTRK